MTESGTDTLGTSRRAVINPLPSFSIAASISVLLAATLCASGRYAEAAAGSAALLCLAFVLSARLPAESILITWFATTPLAYFYIRFPIDKSIITYDRAVFALVAVIILGRSVRSGPRAGAASGRAEQSLPAEGARRPDILPARVAPPPGGIPASRFEIAWALLSLLALTSALMKSVDVAYATRIAVDSFFLPLAAFHIARHHFDARGRAGSLLIGAILLALFLFVTGAFEFATGANLFQYKGSELVREHELRVNGPFASDTSYTIICLLVAVFLRAAPAMLRVRLDRLARLLYALALGAAVLATLLSLFRATAIALVICWLILRRGGGRGPAAKAGGEARARQPMWRGPLLVAGMAMAAVLITFGPFSTGRRITDPRNAFGRLATWEAAAAIAFENPLFGVGLTNYRDYFHAKYNWEDESVESVLHARATDSPHSNLLWIAADLGSVALALYLTANVYLFFMGVRAMKRGAGARQRAAAACYLALFAAYSIPGLTLASGYYSDLNLYFFFMLGLLLNESLQAPSA
ncbi:MAG: O-antigen ligase family protein [Blastocatellia bacterium]